MGADVAAGPHCPFAGGHQAWEARQSARAVSEPCPDRGSGRRFPGFRSEAQASFGMSPLAPRQGRSPGGSPLGGFGTRVPLPAFPSPPPKPWCRSRRDPWPKPLVPPGESMGRSPGLSPVSQLPGPGPVLPDSPFGRSLPSRRWRCVNPKIPLSAGQAVHPEGFPSRLSGSFRPKASGPGWALHEACRFRIR